MLYFSKLYDLLHGKGSQEFKNKKFLFYQEISFSKMLNYGHNYGRSMKEYKNISND